MDPLTIGAFFAWLFGRIASASMRKAARNETKRAIEKAAAEEDRLRKARAEYALQVLQTVQAMNELSQQRSESARRVLARTIKVTQSLASRRSAFAKSGGWFGDQSFAEIERFMKLSEAFESRTSTSIQISNGSAAALGLIQTVNLLENAFPELKELNLHDLVASLPVAGADDMADALGALGEIWVSELFGFAGLLLSGAALLNAREEAAEIRARAREISSNADRIEEVSGRLLGVERNCVGVRSQLRIMDYHQFKLSWYTEQLIKRHPREFLMPKRYRRIIDAFADHTRRYWEILATDVHSMVRANPMSEKPEQTTPPGSDERRSEMPAAKRIAELKRDIAVEKARRNAAQTKLARRLEQRRTSERDTARLFWKQLRSWRGA